LEATRLFRPTRLPGLRPAALHSRPTKPGQEEADANVAEDDPSDIKQTRQAFAYLRRFTATPENCYFCVWEGYSGLSVPPSVLRGPMVTIPHRQYFLIHGSLSDLGSRHETLGPVGSFPPAFAWPADQSWCFAHDVDPHWAGIGAEQALIDTLLNAPELDVVPAQPTEPQPTYY